MAQKAAKQLAARNTAILLRTHLITVGLNVLHVILRFGIFRTSCTPKTYMLYAVLSLPAFAIEIWFERSARPQDGRPGDDLEAKGMTEYMFDVIYWTWTILVAATIFGDAAWWLWAAAPAYAVYLLVTTFGSMRQGLAGLSGQDEASEAKSSNRQKKMERRGGQRVQYRQ